MGSGTNLISQSTTGHRRSPWDSLPSLKQDGSLNDSGYKSNRADSFEQRLEQSIHAHNNKQFFGFLLILDNFYRGVFDRQDSLRSDYLSDRETRYGIVQQASIDSTDSRLCYLTSSEVSELFFHPYFPHPQFQFYRVAMIKKKLNYTLLYIHAYTMLIEKKH